MSRIDRQIVAREERKYQNELQEWYETKDKEMHLEGRPFIPYHQGCKHQGDRCRFIGHNPKGGARIEFIRGWVHPGEEYTSQNVPYENLKVGQWRSYGSLWNGRTESSRVVKTFDELR